MSNRSASIALLLAAWMVPVGWTAVVLAANHIGNGMPGFVLHMISWPLGWTASLLLGAAGSVKWCERGELRLLPRVLGTAFGTASALASFPLGVYVTLQVLSWLNVGSGCVVRS